MAIKPPKGTDSVSNADKLRHEASSYKNIQNELRRTRIARGIEHPHEAIDTPFEVEVFTAGRLGPIDNPIEMGRELRSSAGKVAEKEEHENTDPSPPKRFAP